MAIIAIKVPEKISNKLKKIDVPGKLDLADHITIIYIGPISLKVNEIFKISLLLSEFLEKQSPFEIIANKINSFPAGPDGIPIKADLESKELYKFRKELYNIIKENGMEDLVNGVRGDFKPHKEFSAHINLAYSDEKIKEFVIEPIKWKADCVELWCGKDEEDGPNIEFKFGKKLKEEQMLLLLSGIFKKLSK
jgi:2'-5' RNA ligase